MRSEDGNAYKNIIPILKRGEVFRIDLNARKNTKSTIPLSY